jgi:hypothetical protein
MNGRMLEVEEVERQAFLPSECYVSVKTIGIEQIKQLKPADILRKQSSYIYI